LNFRRLRQFLLDDHLLVLQGLSEMLKNMSPESDITYFNSADKVKAELSTGNYDFFFNGPDDAGCKYKRVSSIL